MSSFAKLIAVVEILLRLCRPLQQMIRKKKRLYNKTKRSGNTSDWKNFKDLRKLIKKKLADAHDDYVSELLSFTEEPSSKLKATKCFWSYQFKIKKIT